MGSATQAVKSASQSVQGAASGISKEANKSVAKDPNVPIGTRISAAADAVGDKFKEMGHNNRADAHRQGARRI